LLALEVALLLIYDISVLVHGGADGLSLDTFQPSNVFSGSVAMGLIFGVGIYGGFEATIIFPTRYVQPQRTIPRATYAVVAILASLYAITAWVFINSYRSNAIMSVLNDDLVGAASASVKQYTGGVAYLAVSLLLISSAFAGKSQHHCAIPFQSQCRRGITASTQ
jgi:amino acid transporter